MGVWGSGGSEFAGYDYVQTDPPANPSEGQTWYDVDADGAFVYDGAGWVEMTVTDHGQLSSIQAGQHRSDSNIRSTVDGQVDADTVDGQHAGDLGAPNSTQSVSVESKNIGNKSTAEGEFADYVQVTAYQGSAAPSGGTLTLEANTFGGNTHTQTFNMQNDDTNRQYSMNFPVSRVSSYTYSSTGSYVNVDSWDTFTVYAANPHSHSL